VISNIVFVWLFMASWAPVFEMLHERAALMLLLAFLPRGIRLVSLSFSELL
jgi:hypothetical protein